MKLLKSILGAICLSILIGLVISIVGILSYGLTNSNNDSNQNKELLLRSYELENQRIELENHRLYLRALEISCTSEFINQYGEVYTRQTN